jgi:hypothetical protein
MRPEFIIIGAMKCGTTALWRYLRAHPGIHLPQGRKNLNFFVAEDHWREGLAWYEGFFAGSESKRRGEVSTEYSKYPHFAGVAARMAQIVPEARLVYLVRHPVERLVSQYLHLVNDGSERRTLTEALAVLEDNPYVDYSRYAYQLEQYLPYYPPQRILILAAEDLRRDPAHTLHRLYDFIGVERVPVANESRIVHTRGEKYRWSFLGRWLKQRPPLLESVWRHSRSLPAGLRAVLDGCLRRPIALPVLDARTRVRLQAVFAEDQQRLRALADGVLPEYGLDTPA